MLKLSATTSVFLAVCVLGLFGASLASAAEPGPGWQVWTRSTPTNFSSEPADGFPDGYNIEVRNAGSEPTDGSRVTIEDVLPAHVTATNVLGYDVGSTMQERGALPIVNFEHVPHLDCELHLRAVTCADASQIPPGDTLYMAVTVDVSGAVVEGESLDNVVKVSGGGAPPASVSRSTLVSRELAPYGIESVSTEASGLDGSTDTQAGDHPYEFTTTYHLNTSPRGAAEEEAKDFVVDLPAGFVGDPQVVQKCQQYLAQKEDCPASSQIGVARLDLGSVGHEITGEVSIVPIFNLVPSKGVAAQFVFTVSGVPTLLFAHVSQDTNYAVRVVVQGITRAGLHMVSTTFFGAPLTDPDIDNRSMGAANVAFLQNPVDCSAGPLETKVRTDSWQDPASWLANGSPNLADPRWKTASAVVYPSITGCDMLQFEPSIQLTPDTTQADEPMGLNVNVKVPQSPDLWPALATPELKNATVTLPAGVSLSPSAADGLQACTDAQLDVESPEPDQCPEASVLGTAKIITPLLEGPLTGRVYLGAPECDPCTAADAADGRMLRIFLVVQGFGVRIKKEGHVYANPSTGQLTSTFENNPQAPAEDIELSFKGGLRAGLATPQSCGAFSATTDFTPWSTPITPNASLISPPFDVSWDGDGGACPAIPPLTPSFSAGTSNPNAGQFSPFTLTFAREDREQDLSGIQVHMPPGLLGSLSGIPLCGEPQAQQGECGQASRIGTMTVAAGPGSHSFYEKGSIYLTGAYRGAPFGLSIVVPTQAGPFNLGNVVVRARINIDVHTSALTVTSDPFPQVIAGIPLRLRTANVTIERPDFIFNPTSCELLHVTATIAGAQGSQTEVSAPFAVSGCAGLHFGPAFKVSTSGKTSKADGASLDAKVTFPAGAQSNIRTVKVDLPKALPSRLTTLQKACTAAQFESNPAGCPAASVIGIARASTPLLPVTLTGPAYFVSHGGEAFPSLIIVLQGYGVRVDLVAATFISKAGITSSTFKSIPDVPVNSFELYLPEGKNSALAANGDLCTQKLSMPTLFTAQDGAQLKQDTKIAVTGCPKSKKTKKAKAKKPTKSNGRAKR
jgi:hypothetical protein